MLDEMETTIAIRMLQDFLKETFCICISMDGITDIYFARD